MLPHSEELFNGDVGYRLHDARRPFDLHKIDVRRVGQTKTCPHIILAPVIAPTGNLPHLPEGFSANGRFQAHLCANRRAVRHSPDELKIGPVVAIAIVPVEKVVFAFGGPTVGNEQVEKTVVVVVTPGAPSRVAKVVYKTAGTDFGERPVPIV